MSILTIIQDVAKNTGFTVPAAVMSATDRELVNLVQFAKEAANEITRRSDWGVLQKSASFAGLGTNSTYALPEDFQRFTKGSNVLIGGVPVRGGLTMDEWALLTPVVGNPRFFLLTGKNVSFYPYPANAAVINYTYQSTNWCSNASANWVTDTDTALIPEELIIKGAIWRQKRLSGQPFDDYMAEFEACMADYVGFDDAARSP